MKISKFFHAPAAVLDAVEKYALSAIFLLFTYRMITGYLETGSFATLIYLIDQLIMLFFILIRRSSDTISTRVDAWLAGFAGTFFGLFFGPASGNPVLYPLVAEGFLICGILVHLSAKLTLRRSFGIVAANRGIKSSGLYQLMRHPMYTGYMISQAGLLLAGPTLNNAIVLCICWSLFIWRINVEERVLQKDPSYAKLARYRIIPGIY